MSGIDIKRFLNRFSQNYTGALNTKSSNNINQTASNTTNSQAHTNTGAQTSSQIVNTAPTYSAQNLRPNAMQNIDRAVYAKEVMQLPRNLNEFIYMLQRGMTQAQFNQMFQNRMFQKANLSQIQAQILAQMQGSNPAEEIANLQMSTKLAEAIKNLEILSNGMINLNNISSMIQKNGKEALTKLIMSMTEASKMGITDLSQMKDMAKLINASISIAAENNPTKTMKLLLMLYLPWLPLEEGIDFEIEITQKESEDDKKDCVLIITITTINYGIIKAILSLTTSNAVAVDIDCIKDFPKNELTLRLQKEQKFYSMESVVNYNETTNENKYKIDKAIAQINTTMHNEINPYLLLMAHAVIKHVIDIDNNKSQGHTEHID